MASAAASISLFLLRGMWMLNDQLALRGRWVRIVPHVIDTILLASAIAMVVMSQQYPFYASWLTAKVLALLVYIGLGMVALKRGKTKRVRAVAFVGAVATFAYIVGVAVTRSAVVV